MKKRFILFTLATLFSAFGILSLAAQESGLYFKTVHVQRVYSHRLGYAVEYFTQEGQVFTTYLPHSWFSAAERIATRVTIDNYATPYLTLYYENGEFAYLRLYVHRQGHGDPTWSSIPSSQDLSMQFDVTEPDIVY